MKWRTEGLKEEDGIIIGSNERKSGSSLGGGKNYSRHNGYPVAFVDFGLSEKMKDWCRERGELIRLRVADIFVKDREEIESLKAEGWEKYYGEAFWTSRKAWFKKPLACLQSPFQKTIWIDTDCEILGSLAPLFKACPSGVAIAKDRIADSYNSGVIVFQRNNPIIQEWADQSWEKNGLFRSDQDLLSEILLEKRGAFSELPAIYNWNVGYGENPDTVICHWLGDMGKIALRHQIIP